MDNIRNSHCCSSQSIVSTSTLVTSVAAARYSQPRFYWTVAAGAAQQKPAAIRKAQLSWFRQVMLDLVIVLMVEV